MKITVFYTALILVCALPVFAQSDHAVSTAAGDQINPAITADGQGNAIIVWHDFRNESDTADDLYAQKIDLDKAINYSLPEAAEVEVTIFDVNGRSVRTLVKTKQTVGTHTAVFDASDLASGVYFYRLRAGHFVQTRKMLLLR